MVPQRARRTCVPNAAFTGWDADGGYAEFAVVPEAFAYRLPDAPGRRRRPRRCSARESSATARCGAPSCRRAGRLGIYGFGASAHLVAQVAIAQGATVHVLTRSAEARRAGARRSARPRPDAADAAPPEPLDAAMLFAPAGELVPVAMRALDQGGTLAVAGIHLSDIPALELLADELFREKQLRSVTANTRADGEEFLRLAAGAAHPADDDAAAPWPKPTRRWPTWPPTGSPAPPCSFPDRPNSARAALASAGSPRSATRASPATAPVNRGVQGPDPKGRSAAAAEAAQRAALSTLSPDSRRTT